MLIFNSRYPGVAKFGIALEWGSRGLEFESRHSDQKSSEIYGFRNFFILCLQLEIHRKSNVRLTVQSLMAAEKRLRVFCAMDR